MFIAEYPLNCAPESTYLPEHENDFIPNIYYKDKSSTGSFAFYYPVKDLFMVGDLNQMGNAALPIRLSMKLAMMTK